jgi:uncharacterized protein YjiS (DUF1127 family)
MEVRMAVIEQSQGGAFGTAVSTRGILGTFVARVRAWQATRATATELKRLSAAQLADIGIEPGDIDGFAERMARRHRF